MGKLKLLLEFLDYQSVRNIVLGAFSIFCGLTLAFLTIWANRSGNLRLASAFALLSLLFVVLILVFVVPPLARSASIEASQLDLPFEFTVAGALFLGILTVVGFAAWNTGNNLLFLILSVLISAFVVSFVVGHISLKKIDVRMRFPEVIFVGQVTPIKVTLLNRKKIFATFSVVTEVRGFDRRKSLVVEDLERILPYKWIEKFIKPPVIRYKLGYFAYVPRNSFQTIQMGHIFRRRGRFIIKDFELSTGFPLGFFRHRRRLLTGEAEVVVLPRIKSKGVEFSASLSRSGDLVKLQRGSGVDLFSLRDYQPQDDIRYVDWKATAKSKRLIVRDFAAEDRRKVQVVFDSRILVSLEEKREYFRYLRVKERENFTAISQKKQVRKRQVSFDIVFEEGVSEASSLLFYFDKEQAETRLVLNEEVGHFGRGRKHLYEQLRKLALVEPSLIESVEGLRYSDELLKEICSDGLTVFICFVDENLLPKEIKARTHVITFSEAKT